MRLWNLWYGFSRLNLFILHQSVLLEFDNLFNQNKICLVVRNRARHILLFYFIDISLSKEDLPYIWDRYYKVDKTHKRGITGTGLGLSIVKKILDLHGAKYGVKSEIGKGSTFWFELKIS